MIYEFLYTTKIDKLLGRGVSIQTDLNCLISMLENYIKEIESGSTSKPSPAMLDYMVFLKTRSIEAIKGFELDLEEVTNFEFDIDLSFIEYEGFDYFEILKGPEDGLVFIVEEYLAELEFVRDFLEDIMAHINDQSTSLFVDSRFIN